MHSIPLDPALVSRINSLAQDMQNDIHAQMAQTANDAIRDLVRELQGQKLWQEQRAFEAQHYQLVKEYLGQYVAFHNEQMIDSDDNQRTLYIRTHRRYPGTVIGIFLVRETSERPIINLRSIHRIAEHQS